MTPSITLIAEERQREIRAAENMDWQQVVLNGGPACFKLGKDGYFCGRAKRWHEKGTHRFRSLAALLRAFDRLQRAQGKGE